MIPPDRLAVVDEKGNYTVRPGKLRVQVGGSLPGARSKELGAAKGVAAELEIVK